MILFNILLFSCFWKKCKHVHQVPYGSYPPTHGPHHSPEQQLMSLSDFSIIHVTSPPPKIPITHTPLKLYDCLPFPLFPIHTLPNYMIPPAPLYTHTHHSDYMIAPPPLYTHTTPTIYDYLPPPQYTPLQLNDCLSPFPIHTHHSDYMIISPFPLRPLYTHTTLTKWMSLPLPYIHTHHSNYMIPPFPHSPIHTHHSDYNPSEYITGKFVILAIIL